MGAMETLISMDSLISLLALSAMEIVLGIDNIVFLAILSGKLPETEQGKVRTTGLFLALFFRIGLLLAISWVMGLTREMFSLFGNGFSGRDLILLGGGLFLIYKATTEIYEKLEAPHTPQTKGAQYKNFAFVLLQIILLDMVFSLDSVITAVGMVKHIPIMIAAMVVAMVVMLFSAKSISSFIEKHPSLKILALSFLLLIGVLLVGEGFGSHVNKGYIYFAMAFSFVVEMLNMRYRKTRNSPG